MGLEKRQLLLGLDAFGDDIQIEAPAQADDRADQGGIVGVIAQATNERLIDFQHIDGEPAQIAQAGISGAEVIDGQPNPQHLQPVQRGHGRLDVLHQYTFGDLQFQQAGGHSRLFEYLFDAFDEITLTKVDGRCVD
ncbi:hypothetical protein D3C86_1787030 [compost metagenome]